MNSYKYKYLLSPDAAESADPLNTNVNDVNTDYPLLPASHYQFKLDECKKLPNKHGTGDNLVIPHKLAESAQDVKGEPVNPGHTITSYISLVTTDGGNGKQPYTIESIKKSIARVAKAAGISATIREIINNPAMLDGKLVRAKVKVSKETDEYPASNSISGYATD